MIKIVTRHAGMVEWLKSRGITGEVIPHVTDERDVKDCHIVGALPMHLACLAKSITVVTMNLLPEQRGKDLSVMEMEVAKAQLQTYRVSGPYSSPEEVDAAIESEALDAEDYLHLCGGQEESR